MGAKERFADKTFEQPSSENDNDDDDYLISVFRLLFCVHVILNKDMFYGLSRAFCNVPKYVTICVPFQPND